MKKIDVYNVKCLCLIFIMQLRMCLFCFYQKYLYIHLSLYWVFFFNFSVLQQSLYVCLIYVGEGQIRGWNLSPVINVLLYNMYLWLSPLRSKRQSMIFISAFLCSKFYALIFFSNWVDLLPNLTHFEKTISSLGKDLVQKNGLTQYSLKAI